MLSVRADYVLSSLQLAVCERASSTTSASAFGRPPRLPNVPFSNGIQRLYFSGGLGIPTRPERRNAQCAAAGHDLPGAFRVAPDKYRIRLKAAVMVHRKRRHVRTSAGTWERSRAGPGI